MTLNPEVVDTQEPANQEEPAIEKNEVPPSVPTPITQPDTASKKQGNPETKTT